MYKHVFPCISQGEIFYAQNTQLTICGTRLSFILVTQRDYRATKCANSKYNEYSL